MLAANTPLAGKTGTVSMTGGNRDIWMAAYTPEMSVAVWMGYDQTDAHHKLPNGITGGTQHGVARGSFFKQAYADREKPRFASPMVWYG